MDDKKRKGTPEGRNIIDLDAAREEKRRAERAEEKRMARSARPSLRRRMLSLFLVLVLVLCAARSPKSVLRRTKAGEPIPFSMTAAAPAPLRYWAIT